MATDLAVGSQAPAFKLPRDGGGTVALADFKGRKLVISPKRPTKMLEAYGRLGQKIHVWEDLHGRHPGHLS